LGRDYGPNHTVEFETSKRKTSDRIQYGDSKLVIEWLMILKEEFLTFISFTFSNFRAHNAVADSLAKKAVESIHGQLEMTKADGEEVANLSLVEFNAISKSDNYSPNDSFIPFASLNNYTLKISTTGTR